MEKRIKKSLPDEWNVHLADRNAKPVSSMLRKQLRKFTTDLPNSRPDQPLVPRILLRQWR